MGKFKENDLRNKWYDDISLWLDKKGKRVSDECVCPRCGMNVNVETNNCDYSQYCKEYVICESCVFDEILRDSMGINQADFSRWFISTNERLSYLKSDIKNFCESVT